MSFCKGLLRNRGIEPICPSAIFKSPIADDQEQNFDFHFLLGRNVEGHKKHEGGWRRFYLERCVGRALDESGDGEFAIVTLKLMGYKIKTKGDLNKCCCSYKLDFH